MEQLVQSHYKSLKPVVLYREDVETILLLMQEVSAHVEITTKEARWADLNELWEQKKETFSNFQLCTGYQMVQMVSLELNQNSVFLYISKDDLSSRGAFEKIKALLELRTRPCFKFVEPLALGSLTAGLCFGSLFIAVTSAVQGKNWFATVIAGIFALALFWVWRATSQITF
jgi:hypothetical protein